MRTVTSRLEYRENSAWFIAREGRSPHGLERGGPVAARADKPSTESSNMRAALQPRNGDSAAGDGLLGSRWRRAGAGKARR
jgi:hypothetical protein